MRTKDLLIRTQRVAFQTLANGFKSNRISHAYLISGSVESSLKELAVYLAKSLVCSNLEPLACEECINCIRIEEHNYPDYIFIDGSNKTNGSKTDLSQGYSSYTISNSDTFNEEYLMQLIHGEE